MNQGNDPDHARDDGVWQDGALLLRFPGQHDGEERRGPRSRGSGRRVLMSASRGPVRTPSPSAYDDEKRDAAPSGPAAPFRPLLCVSTWVSPRVGR